MGMKLSLVSLTIASLAGTLVNCDSFYDTLDSASSDSAWRAAAKRKRRPPGWASKQPNGRAETDSKESFRVEWTVLWVLAAIAAVAVLALVAYHLESNYWMESVPEIQPGDIEEGFIDVNLKAGLIDVTVTSDSARPSASSTVRYATVVPLDSVPEEPEAQFEIDEGLRAAYPPQRT